MTFLSQIRRTVADAIKTITSREGLRYLYGVSLYRNAVYLTWSSAVLGITGFIFWIGAARLYSTEAVGLASAAISAMNLLALLSTLGLDYGVIRFLPNAGARARDMINTCFTILVVTSVVSALIFLAGLDIWSPALLLLREHPVYFISFVAFTTASALMLFVRATFIAQRRAGFVAVTQGVIFGCLRLILLPILAVLFQTFGIFASWGVVNLVAIAAGILWFFPRVQPDYRPSIMFRKDIANEMVRFSFNNYVANLFVMALGPILPIMVVNLLGATLNAYFYIAWSIGYQLFLIPMMISFALFAEGSHDEDKLAREIRRSLKLTFTILIPTVLLILLLGDKILLLFGTAYSENATTLLRILAISALPLSLNQIYFSVKRVEMKMKGVVGLSVFVAIATIALSYVLLPRMGIIGAGIAWLAGQGVVCIFTAQSLFRTALSKVKPI